MQNKNHFYQKLQREYAGKLVAYKNKRVLASALNSKDLINKLAKKNLLQDKEITFAGPIQKQNKLYVYQLSLQEKAN